MVDYLRTNILSIDCFGTYPLTTSKQFVIIFILNPMNNKFNPKEFFSRFPDDNSCLEEIKKIRWPNGITCPVCKKVTKFYKVKRRTAYACEFGGTTVYPLADTVLEKTTTPLQYWFYAMYLVTKTRSGISAKQLQRELGVTYKTAWRMFKQIRMLMSDNSIS